MRVGIDIDGVILDYENVMRTYARFYNKYILKKEVIDEHRFNYLERYNWNDEEKKEFMKLFSKHATITSPLIPYAKEGLDHLKSLGCKLIAITSRGSINEESIDYVNEKLKMHDIVFDKICWKSTDKVETCKENDIDIMIDDNIKICESLNNKGIVSIYFNTEGSTSEQFMSFSSWITISTYFSNILNKSIDYKKILIPKY